MPRSWNGKLGFARLSGQLATADNLAFQRAALPFVRLLWPEAVEAPERRSFDRAGADHLVWSDQGGLPLVAQCKGFEAGERDITDAHIRQCLRSIDRFADSGLMTKHYALIHNRDGRNADFRAAVGQRLAELVASGAAGAAVLLDRQAFLNTAFDAMLDRVIAHATALARQAFQGIDEFLGGQGAVSDVPFKVCTMVVDQHRLITVDEPSTFDGDPIDHIALAGDATSLIVGEFGTGKTTLLGRVGERAGGVVMVAAARFPANAIGAADLAEICCGIDDFLEAFPQEDRAMLRPVARAAARFMLSERGRNAPSIPLLIDGIDESIFFSRRGGVQWMFNALRDLRGPTVLTVRTEFWRARQTDFATAFGLEAIGHRQSHQRTRYPLIELMWWDSRRIGEAASNYRRSLTDDGQRRHMDAFIDLVSGGQYESLFGDIPQRPLFMRLLLDTVAVNGLRSLDRCALMDSWMRLKVVRDVEEPPRARGPGRQPVVDEDEGIDTVVEVSLSAASAAAEIMTTVADERLQLLPSCPLTAVLEREPRLARIGDPTGLLLHGILMPLPRGKIGGPVHVRFAHRAFHEYLLATKYVRSERPANVDLDTGVLEWLAAFEADGGAT